MARKHKLSKINFGPGLICRNLLFALIICTQTESFWSNLFALEAYPYLSIALIEIIVLVNNQCLYVHTNVVCNMAVSMLVARVGNSSARCLGSLMRVQKGCYLSHEYDANLQENQNVVR